MNCQHAKSSFAILSVEEASCAEMRELQEHLAECPPCEKEWVVFQQTLLIVSTTPQPLLSAEQSRLMWEECARRCMDKTEEKRLAAQRSASGGWSLSQWLGMQPRWGWAALGGAVAVFGAVWFLAPQDDAPTPTWAANDPGMTQLVRFDRPPTAASPFINHHSAMAFDPFADHVGSTLVSYSATSSEMNPSQELPGAASPGATSSTTP
jgi:hypothetical protein